MFFYLTNPDRYGVTDIATLYSPGNLTVTTLRATQHVVAGFTDYGMTLVACEDIWLSFIHISALSTDLFGEITSYDGWSLTGEHSTGGETYRSWTKEVDVDVTAGEVLGTTGGNTGIWAWDFSMVDLRISQEKSVVNPERYSYWRWMPTGSGGTKIATAGALSGVCFLLYYGEGPVLDQLAGLVKRDKVEGETIPCGSYLQDVPGTAQGNWFLSGVSGTNPENPHLALVHSTLHPDRAVLSVGTSLQGLRYGTYEFLPAEQGLLDRDFKDITPDGRTYGYRVVRHDNIDFDGIVIVRMPDEETLWIEALTGAITEPSSWAFTGNKTIFVR